MSSRLMELPNGCIVIVTNVDRLNAAILRPPAAHLAAKLVVGLFSISYSGYILTQAASFAGSGDTGQAALAALAALALPTALLFFIGLSARGDTRMVIDDFGVTQSWYLGERKIADLSKWPWTRVHDVKSGMKVPGSVWIRTTLEWRPIAIGLTPEQCEIIVQQVWQRIRGSA